MSYCKYIVETVIQIPSRCVLIYAAILLTYTHQSGQKENENYYGRSSWIRWRYLCICRPVEQFLHRIRSGAVNQQSVNIRHERLKIVNDPVRETLGQFVSTNDVSERVERSIVYWCDDAREDVAVGEEAEVVRRAGGGGEQGAGSDWRLIKKCSIVDWCQESN